MLLSSLTNFASSSEALSNIKFNSVKKIIPPAMKKSMTNLITIIQGKKAQLPNLVRVFKAIIQSVNS